MSLNHERSATFYPEQARKSRYRILTEQVLDALATGRVNEEYFLYGEDLVGTVPGSFPRKRALLDIIHRQIGSQNAYEHARLLRDKVGFTRWLEDAGFPGPSILGIGVDGRIRVDETEDSVEHFLLGRARPVFAKPINGAGGEGAHLIEVRRGDLFVDRKRTEWKTLRGLLKGEVLFQDVVEQHPAVAAIYSGSLNTLRMVTLLVDGRARLIASVLRLGNNGSVTDNFSDSGIAVPVDITTGKLRSPGFYRRGMLGRPTCHPDSGISFDGFDLPNFSVCRETVEEAHTRLGGLISVGWDVAVGSSGPLVIEANAFWTPRFHIATDPEFLGRYVPAVAPWLTRRDRSWAARFL